MHPSLPDHVSLSTTIIKLLSRELHMPVDEVRLDFPLTRYGLDSIAALTIAGELEEQLDLELPSTLLWDCPTINDLTNFLITALQARVAVQRAA